MLQVGDSAGRGRARHAVVISEVSEARMVRPGLETEPETSSPGVNKSYALGM